MHNYIVKLVNIECITLQLFNLNKNKKYKLKDIFKIKKTVHN